ncbi:MAG: DinB family protein [Paludibacter sp.]|nr:DinB family protein [Paludibacter sp.]
MNEFDKNNQELLALIEEWVPKLMYLPEEVIENRKNKQHRTIKQIVGHMIDSASNNTHRIVHLQYQPNPLIYPDYANLGNNDRWIAIQDYQHENWEDLVQLWKYTNIHIAHVIKAVNPEKLNNEWITALNVKVSLHSMIVNYTGHIRLHLNEIEELIAST